MAEILNKNLVTGIFGDWPTFHDAEVLTMTLDRSKSGEFAGPTIDSAIHVFRMTSKIDERGYYVLEKHTLVTLRFHRVVEASLAQFNHQNVLQELFIQDISGRQVEGVHFEVTFESTFGLSARFQCAGVTVLSAEPFVVSPRKDDRGGGV